MLQNNSAATLWAEIAKIYLAAVCNSGQTYEAEKEGNIAVQTVMLADVLCEAYAMRFSEDERGESMQKQAKTAPRPEPAASPVSTPETAHSVLNQINALQSASANENPILQVDHLVDKFRAGLKGLVPMPPVPAPAKRRTIKP